MPSSTTYPELESELRNRLGDAVLEGGGENNGQLILHVEPERRPDALRACKERGFTFYTFCGGVDWPDQQRLEVMDHVYSYERRQHVTLKFSLPRDNPRLPTGSGVYAGADWHERETWELFGINFVGHPHLARLLLPDWQEGFPMRKDAVLDARVTKPWPGDFFEA
jgi:NADH-quinone oxidoreductase subunit C